MNITIVAPTNASNIEAIVFDKMNGLCVYAHMKTATPSDIKEDNSPHTIARHRHFKIRFIILDHLT